MAEVLHKIDISSLEDETRQQVGETSLLLLIIEIESHFRY